MLVYLIYYDGISCVLLGTAVCGDQLYYRSLLMRLMHLLHGVWLFVVYWNFGWLLVNFWLVVEFLFHVGQ